MVVAFLIEIVQDKTYSVVDKPSMEMLPRSVG